MAAFMQQRFLITGAAGQLGHELHRQLSEKRNNRGQVDREQSIPKTRDSLDVTDKEAVFSWVRESRPDAIVHCAAYTDVQRAEVDRSVCWHTNVTGTHNIACAASHHSIPLFFISTNYVFGADQREAPYGEGEPPAPTNFYGHTKMAAEGTVTRWCGSRHSPWFIIRTAGLFERPWRDYKNLLQGLFNALSSKKQDTVPVVNDVSMSIAYAPHVAKAIVWMLQHLNQIPEGIYHLVSDGCCSPFDIADLLAWRMETYTRPNGIGRDEYANMRKQSPQTFPKYTCLKNVCYAKLGGPPLGNWRDAVSSWMKEKKEGTPEFVGAQGLY